MQSTTLLTMTINKQIQA